MIRNKLRRDNSRRFLWFEGNLNYQRIRNKQSQYFFSQKNSNETFIWDPKLFGEFVGKGWSWIEFTQSGKKIEIKIKMKMKSKEKKEVRWDEVAKFELIDLNSKLFIWRRETEFDP